MMESNAPMLHDSTRDYNRVRLWFGLVGGAIAWLVHLMGAYAIAEFGCVGTTQEYSFLGITLVSWLLIGLTLVTTAAALLAAWAAHGMEQTQPVDPSEVQHEPVHGIARAGALTSGMSAFVILFESVPILYYLGGC